MPRQEELNTILLVDDDRLVLLALQETLQREGYRILTASNGEEAVHVLANKPVALVICDQKMPGISGMDVLKKAQTLQPDTERIIITGNTDLDIVLQAVNIGHVSQFILKPWDEASLKQTIATSIDKFRLFVENKNLHDLILSQHQALANTHEILRRELNIGARIHETLLEGKIPANVPGFHIHATTIPSHEIDGDFFEFYRPASNILDIVVGDVMGKGIPAALVGTAVKSNLIHYALPFSHALIVSKQGFWDEDLLQPNEILAHLHEKLTSPLIQLEFFVSLFYGRFNLQKQTLTYVDCGSTRPIHYLAQEKKAVSLKGGGLPLGAIENQAYELHTTSYAVGDFFVFFSDGVTETQSKNKEFFGFDRLIEIIENHSDKDPTALIDIIEASLKSFSKQETFDDDITLIIVKVASLALALSSPHPVVEFRASLSQLQAVRESVARLCLQAPGDSEALSSMLQLAINEAFCNIVKHGYKGKTDGIIRLRNEITDKGISIEISDQGDAFNPGKVKEPSLAGSETNGFGLFIIREIADRVSYVPKEAQDGWNHLCIYKTFLQKGHSMQFAQVIEDNVTIITPQGDSLDAKGAPQLKENVINLITSHDATHVVFDMSNLKFVDSSGLGALLSILRVLHSMGGELKLAKMNKSVRALFELVSMHKIFEIYNSKEEAIHSFKEK